MGGVVAVGGIPVMVGDTGVVTGTALPSEVDAVMVAENAQPTSEAVGTYTCDPPFESGLQDVLFGRHRFHW